jgi:hypothetical protein
MALLVLSAAPARAATPPRIVVAVLPNGTDPARLGEVPGVSPALMSAGLGRVGAEQTYLDISQGNRIFGGFYDDELPFLFPYHGDVPHWDEIVDRAGSAPADIVPGLLATTLARHGIAARADPALLTPSLIAVDEHGRIGQAKGPCSRIAACPPGLMVQPSAVGRLPGLIRGLRGDDLLIAIERAPPDSHHGLAFGIAGRGFGGNLTSGSTRMRGMVLSTDVAPTVLRRLGIPIPDEMLGRPIHSEGGIDPPRLTALDARLARIAPRRAPVIGGNLFIWVLAAAAVAAIGRRRVARTALAVLGVSCVYLPAFLLAGAALEPSRLGERVIVGLGAPLLAMLTVRFARGYRAFAVACATTVGVYAADMVAGLDLTPLSLMGPNPSLGVRFYGIGNELEATLAAMMVLGTGAALACLPNWSRRRQAWTFAAVAVLCTLIFAAGRFGADVGAAIVMPVAGATAAVYALGLRGRRFLALVIAAPIAGVAVLVAMDLLLGGDSHLTRSVLHAHGTQDLADIAYRRLRSAANSFARPVNGFFLLLAIAGLVAALVYRRRIAAWFEGREPALAGLVGAVAATLAGALANDSGALILIIGTGVMTAYACFAWSQSTHDAKVRDKAHETPHPPVGKIA